MFSFLLFAIFSVFVLELDNIYIFFFTFYVGPAYFTSGKCLMKIRSEACSKLQYYVHEEAVLLVPLVVENPTHTRRLASRIF
jgi:hypothetical protein